MTPVSNLSGAEQGYQYALGLEGWAMAALAENWRLSGNTDSRIEPWPRPLPVIQVDGGQRVRAGAYGLRRALARGAEGAAAT